MKLALVSEVFFGRAAEDRLVDLLGEVRGRGAELALLPELALDPWVPATRARSAQDAEEPDGVRAQLLARAAARVGIAVIGGAIVQTGTVRHNTAIAVDARGELRARYAKTHVPQEPGFWERDHYDDGPVAATPFELAAVRCGIQICSDINRPEGVHALAAAGADLVLHPRATEPETWDAWRLVIRATALTSCCWIASVNRPRPEGGTPLGGPSCVVGPDGEIVVERCETVVLAEVDPLAVAQRRKDYPGYLPVRSELYAEAWRAASRR